MSSYQIWFLIMKNIKVDTYSEGSNILWIRYELISNMVFDNTISLL